MTGKKASSARQFFLIADSEVFDRVTKVRVVSSCDRCIITYDNGTECGATFKRCVRNGTSSLINHLKKVHDGNPQVQDALRNCSVKVRESKLNI